MKSVKSDKSCEPTVDYPYLMEGIDGRIVLMTGVTDRGCAGTIMYAPRYSVNPVGHWSEGWDVDYFKPYNGSVCLEN